jgi:AcrR family transcriptional regulator
MSKVKLSRREREKNEHKGEILKAALKLFSEKGFHNVSMNDIASKSEFGVGTLYTFFESKEQLFVELMKTGIEKFAQILIPILDSNKEEEKKLSEFIQAHVDLIESNIEFIRLYISHYGTTTSVIPMLKDISIDLKVITAKKLESIIRTGIQKQIFRRVHPEIVALSLRATVEAFGLKSSEHFDKVKTKDGFMKIENFFLNSLLRKETDNDTKTN